MTCGARGRQTISPSPPAATSRSSSSKIFTVKPSAFTMPAEPGLAARPGGSQEISDASVVPYALLNVATPNRSR